MSNVSPFLWLLLAAASVETAVLSWYQWQNYLAFVTQSGDVGNYNQAFFTTIHLQGFFYYTTNIPGGSRGTLWAVHFSPSLLVVLPFYALVQSPTGLLVLKQAALAFACVPLYLLGKLYFRGEVLPTTIAGLYLLSPLTLTTDWNNFDPEALVPLFLLLSLYFFARGRFWPFLVFWILALGTIEGAPPLLILFAVGGLIGTYLAPATSPYWTAAQQRRPLLIGMIVAIAWMGLSALELFLVGPRGGAFGGAYATRYTVLGATSFPDVVPQAVFHPKLAWAALNYQGSQKDIFLAILLLSGGALWVAGGLRYLLPFAGFVGLALLSNDPPLYSLGSEYPGLVLGFLFAGLVEGLAALTDWLNSRPPGWRHERLRADLGNQVRLTWTFLSSISSSRPDVEGLLTDLRTAIKLIQSDELPAAERIIRRVVRGAARLGDSATLVPRTAASNSGTSRDGSPRSSTPGAARPSRLSLRARSTTLLIGTYALVVISVAVAVGLSNPLISQPVAGEQSATWGYPAVTPADIALQSTLDLIPSQSPVLTTPHIFPELSSRRNAFVVPPAQHLLDNESLAQDFGTWLNQSDFVAVDYLVDTSGAELLQLETNLTGFGVFASNDGAVLFERGWSGSPKVFTPLVYDVAGGDLKARSGSVSHMFSSSLGPTLFHPSGGAVEQSIWAGPPILYLPLGSYSVTYKLELSAPNPGNQVMLGVKEQAAEVVRHPVLSLGGYAYYRDSFGPAVQNFTSVAHSVVSTTVAESGFESVAVTQDFDLNETSYVEFPGTELSTSMSLYLVSIDVMQLSAFS